MTGWTYIVIGVFLMALGTISIGYGWHILGRPSSSPAISNVEQVVILSPQQERLLRLIYNNQVHFGAKKLVISRSGRLHFDDPKEQTNQIDLAMELLGNRLDPAVRAHEFESLMEGMPPEYLKMIPETRWDNPFVVTVTEAGIRHLDRR